MKNRVWFIVGAFSAAACAQTPKPSVGVTPAAAPKADSAEPIKAYDKVITSKAITHVGLITTHQLDDKLYFETPRSILGTDMLLVTSVARASTGQTKQSGGAWSATTSYAGIASATASSSGASATMSSPIRRSPSP